MLKFTIKRFRHLKKIPFVQYSTKSNSVKISTKNQVQVVTLNRPDNLNALNLEMVKKLNLMYEHWDHDEESKAVILQGEGKHFCAGGDIKDISDNKDTHFFKEEYKLNYLIYSLKIPHIAIIDGVTMGGGVGVSVHGSTRVATEKSLFAMPEAQIGFFCDVGGSYFLPRLENNLGMYLGLTGARLKGDELLKAGIATHFVPSDKIEELKEKLIETNCVNLDQTINEVHNQEEAKKKAKLSADIEVLNESFSKVSVEEIVNSLRKNGDEFSLNALRSLERNSPTSLKVIHEQITRGKNLELKQCLDMELNIAQQMMEGKDFFEGVRALLIDKDKNPKWEPDNLEGVTRTEVLKYF